MINKEYSYRDFTNKSLSKIDPKELNDTEIVGSNFYQEAKLNDSVLSVKKDNIFPAGMKGVKFIRCNLDNVSVPEGNTVDATCINRIIKVDVDNSDYVWSSAGARIRKV